MIQCGTQIRLTAVEVERWLRLTSFDPRYIETMDELRSFVRYCKHHWRGRSPSRRRLRVLIDEEYALCVQPGRLILNRKKEISNASSR
jgi:hypothetical protein